MPPNAVAAATDRDPYPYYARLREELPFHYDETLGLWVAASAAAIDEVLAHPQLRVRPPGEQVPRALQGTPAGEVFALLVRMNDGEFHARHRPAVQADAARLTLDDVALAAREALRDLAPRCDANQLLSRIPVQAMARLAGVTARELDGTVAFIEDFVAGIAAGAAPDVIARANLAAQALMGQGEAAGLDKVRAANRIAMMQQSLDATAGLVGNAALQLLREPLHMPRDSLAWQSFVAEVARWDSPVQNTRRFAAADTFIAGQRVTEGQGVLVLLASGNRDERVNPDPDRFDTARASPRCFSFGAGPHRCPGDAIALRLAAAALEVMQADGWLPTMFARPRGYRSLPNARIPVFDT